jgi:hypothetical protein
MSVINEYDELPNEVQVIVDTFNEDLSSYKECTRITNELELIGWTCDFGLDGELYDFEKI